MPVYSFITTISAPDREAAEAAASEIRVSAEEGIEAAIQDDEVPEGVEVVHTDLTVVDLSHSPVHAALDNLVTALADLGFGDDDEPVNGGDCVDVICEYWPRLAPLATTWPLPPRFAQLRTQIMVGTRVLSVKGETSDTDHGERHTGEHAVGTITAIDDSQEHAICLAFEPSEVSVRLSLAELVDEDLYEIDPEPVYLGRKEVVEEVERLLGNGGTHELAVRVYESMREQGMVEHTGRGFVIERDANVFQVAADLSQTDMPKQDGPYPAHLARADRLLSADELRVKYSTPNDGGEHPRYLRKHWKADVEIDSTIRGYWDWVQAQLEQEGD